MPFSDAGLSGSREGVKLADQLFGAKMSVTAEHLHGFVAADRGYFLVAEAGFNKPTYGLVTQIVKTEIDQPCTFLDPVPDLRELVRAPFLVAAWLSEKH